MLPALPVLAGLTFVGWKAHKNNLRSGRRGVVGAATSQLGNANPLRYWQDVVPGVSVAPGTSWCGAFALWSLHQAGLLITISWEFGIGFLYRLPTTLAPKPGDIAYFSNYQHEAVIESVNVDGTITLINGNGTGGAVTRSTGPAAHATAFYSIAGLVGET